MAKKIDDKKLEKEIMDHIRDLDSSYIIRDQEFDEYERMYLMRWPDRPTATDTVKPTLSPTARDKVDGAIRLLSSQKPIFHVSSESTAEKDKIEKIESTLSRWWEQAGKVNRRPLHYDMILSMILYDEIHTVITPVKDYVDKNKDDKRIKRIADQTPILFQSWNPHYSHAEFDEFGLCAYHRKTEESWSSVRRKYSDLIGDKFVNKSNNLNTNVELFYDLDYFGVWIDGENIWLEEHGLPCIPIDVTFANGSSFFEKEEDKRQPMLFPLLRSKLWDRENLLLTVIYSQLFSIGMTPIMVYRSKPGDPLDLQMDNSHGFSVATLKEGESLEIITNKGILPQETQNVMQVTSDLIDESTIYSTAFGEKSQGDSTFSETSLLAQSARLPLIAPQRMGGFGISSVVELALMVMKERNINFDKNGITLKSKDIPNDIEVNVTLDVILPHERLQNATIAKALVDSGFASREWAQNNVLGITNTEEMKKQSLEDQASELLKQQGFQLLLAKLATQEQQTQAQQAAQQTQEQPVQTVDQYIDQAHQQIPLEQEVPQTGQQLGQDAVNQLYQNAMPQMTAGQGQDIGSMGLPPQMGGMVPGQQGLNGTADEGMVLR